MTTANLIEIFCILDEFCKKKTLLCSDVFFGCPDGLEPSTFRTTI